MQGSESQTILHGVLPDELRHIASDTVNCLRILLETALRHCSGSSFRESAALDRLSGFQFLSCTPA
jgi:hypothetical protein